MYQSRRERLKQKTKEFLWIPNLIKSDRLRALFMVTPFFSASLKRSFWQC